MTDPLVRVRQFIAHANDPANTVEAQRTYALLACKAIKELGLELTPPGRAGASNAPGMMIDLEQLFKTIIENIGPEIPAELRRRRKSAKKTWKKDDDPPICIQCGLRNWDPSRSDKRCSNCGFYADRANK